tara:strand:- start:184 stop:540 length:357 start_codon:yes stop_codon:yes gene_type:complete
MERKIKKLFLSNFRNSILTSKEPWLVKFTSDTCPLCHGLEPVFDQLALAFQDRVNFGNVNIRVEKKLAEIFAQEGVPTLYYFKQKETREIEWPEDPDPESGYSFEHLAQYLAGKLSNG